MKFLNKPLFLLSFMIFSLPTFSQTIPSLFYYSDFVRGQRSSDELLSTVVERFKRTNINEILFPERPALTAARYSKSYFDYTLLVLSNMSQKTPNILNAMAQKPNIPLYQIFSDGTAFQIPASISDQWQKIPNHLNQIYSERPRTETEVKELANAFMQNKSIENLEKIQRGLLGLVLQKNDIEHLLSDKFLLPQDYRLILKTLLKKVATKSKELKLPGKVTDTLPEFAQKIGLARFGDERKGILITPMSRFEAIFKGVGPGECVRSCSYRYMDAFLNDALHFKIIRDDDEVAYIGIYKTKILKSKKQIWFIETIQGPTLSDPKVRTEYVKGIISFLQREALKHDALVGVPAQSDNSFNFKEVIAEISTRPEYINGESVALELTTANETSNMLQLIQSTKSDLDSKIKNAAGYPFENLINGFVFNGGRAIVLRPQPGQPDWVWKKTSDLTQENPTTSSENITLSIDEKIGIVSKFYNGYAQAKILYDQLATTTSSSDKELLKRSIFTETPIEVAESDYETQFSYVANQIANVRQSFERAQRLKTELSLKAHSLSDWIKILNLGDTKKELIERFILESLVHLEHYDTRDFNWIEFYKKTMTLIKTPSAEHYFARVIARNLNTAKDYKELVAIMSGQIKEIGPGIDKEKKRKVIADTWEHFFPANEPLSDQLEFLSVILKELGDNQDLAVRKKFMFKQKNLDLLPSINSIAISEQTTSYFKEQMSVVNSDIIKSFAKKLDPREFKESWQKISQVIIMTNEHKAAIDLLTHGLVTKNMCSTFYK